MLNPVRCAREDIKIIPKKKRSKSSFLNHAYIKDWRYEALAGLILVTEILYHVKWTITYLLIWLNIP